MTDETPRRALYINVVHEARLRMHGDSSFLHPLCDPKVRWDPAQETRRVVVTCFECLSAERWREAFMPDMTVAEYIDMHHMRNMVSRG